MSQIHRDPPDDRYEVPRAVFTSYVPRDGPFAPTIKARTPAGEIQLIDKNGDGVFEYGFLLGDHPRTDDWCPPIEPLADDIRAALEAASGQTIDLTKHTKHNGSGGDAP